jgi:hypothetical protein
MVIEAQYDPKMYKDGLGIVAELVGQGIRFDNPYSNPKASTPLDFWYEAQTGRWHVRQKS